MSHSSDINQLLYTWNPPESGDLRSVEIEDDSLRDGLQGAFVRKPTVEEKIELFELSDAVGCQHAIVGFPASSQREYDDSRQIIEAMQTRGLRQMPWMLSRALISDLDPILALKKESGISVGAAFFMGTSPLRRAVENWDWNQVLRNVATAIAYCVEQGLPFSLSIEDASRTPPEELRELIRLGAEANGYSISICDTVGESTPDGATNLVRFTCEEIAKSGATTKVLWHGHNDRGLAVANSIAAVGAGARIIGGSFLGIGERTGNASLEQVILYLYQNGAVDWNIDKLVGYCEKLGEYTNTPIPASMPLVGSQAFATCTGTHSAAVLKARAISVEYEDYIFSAVPASKLGLPQNIMIGPTSGLANARYILERLDLPSSEEAANALLQQAKTENGWMQHKDIRGWAKANLNEEKA